jgi:hypothetical protein
MMAHRDVSGIRLLTRNGKDWTGRFPNHCGRRLIRAGRQLDFSPAPASDAAAALATTATDCGDHDSPIIRSRLSPAAHLTRPSRQSPLP